MGFWGALKEWIGNMDFLKLVTETKINNIVAALDEPVLHFTAVEMTITQVYIVVLGKGKV